LATLENSFFGSSEKIHHSTQPEKNFPRPWLQDKIAVSLAEIYI